LIVLSRRNLRRLLPNTARDRDGDRAFKFVSVSLVIDPASKIGR